MLLEPGAGHAVGVQRGVEALHHVALQVEGLAQLPVLDALHGGGDAPEDAQLVAGVGELPALEVGELQAEGAHQIVVHQGRGGGLQVGGHQHGKGAAFATQHKFVLIVAIKIGCSEVIILI